MRFSSEDTSYSACGMEFNIMLCSEPLGIFYMMIGKFDQE